MKVTVPVDPLANPPAVQDVSEPSVIDVGEQLNVMLPPEPNPDEPIEKDAEGLTMLSSPKLAPEFSWSVTVPPLA